MTLETGAPSGGNSVFVAAATVAVFVFCALAPLFYALGLTEWLIVSFCLSVMSGSALLSAYYCNQFYTHLIHSRETRWAARERLVKSQVGKMVVEDGWDVSMALPASQQAENVTVMAREIQRGNGAPLVVHDAIPTTEWEWRQALAALIDWAVAVGSLGSAELVGRDRALIRSSDWVELTDTLARNGLVSKSNGRPTHLAGDLTYRALCEQITGGRMEIPTIVPPRVRPAPMLSGAKIAEGFEKLKA